MVSQNFAAIDYDACHTHSHSGAIYGIGHTPAEAIADARRSGDPESRYDVVEVSDAAYAHIKDRGGAPGSVAIDTHERYIRTHAEAESL